LHKEVSKHGYIKTLTGQRLYVPIEDPHKAVSAKVQGTAGNVIGQAMVNVSDFFSREYPEGKTIMQVHDELVFEVPEDYPKEIESGIEESMVCIQDRIEIPLEVDGEIIHNNWAEGVSL
jgi:DNA polymerase-1